MCQNSKPYKSITDTSCPSRSTSLLLVAVDVVVRGGVVRGGVVRVFGVCLVLVYTRSASPIPRLFNHVCSSVCVGVVVVGYYCRCPYERTTRASDLKSIWPSGSGQPRRCLCERLFGGPSRHDNCGSCSCRSMCVGVLVPTELAADCC